jgi:hypothetical protein
MIQLLRHPVNRQARAIPIQATHPGGVVKMHKRPASKMCKKTKVHCS